MKNDLRSYDRNFCNCVKKPEKNSGLQRGLNPWPRDTGATLYQLSYEATDVGSRSILGSYVPVKDMKVNDAYEINHMWTADMKSKLSFFLSTFRDPGGGNTNFSAGHFLRKANWAILIKLASCWEWQTCHHSVDSGFPFCILKSEAKIVNRPEKADIEMLQDWTSAECPHVNLR